MKKNLEEVRISVAPVAWVNDGTRIRLAEKPVSGKTDNLDRETLKTILLKIRDLKKTDQCQELISPDPLQDAITLLRWAPKDR